MSTSAQTADGPSTANFSAIFETALNEYKTRTGQDLRSHPFAISLENNNSPDAILEIFRKQAQAFDKFRGGDDKLMACLAPVVDILFALSPVLGEGIGLPFPPAKTIFTGIGVLLGAVKDAIASYEKLVDLFERIRFFLQRLGRYTGLSLPLDTIQLLAKIMAQVLCILALSTKAMKEGRAKKVLKKLVGRTDVEDALQRLDALTKEENLMTAARNLEITNNVDVNVTATQKVIDHVDENVTEIKEVVRNVHGNIRSISDNVKQTKCVMDESQRNQLREKIRTWLVSPDPSINHNTACDIHHEGTASWFLQGNTFDDWKNNGSVLWIRGNPGSGKSVLCSAVIEEVKRMRTDRSALIGYYYFDFKDAAKRDVRGMLAALLKQLVGDSDACWDVLYQLYESCRVGSEQPGGAALAECLNSMVRLQGQVPVFIILDALDECPNDTGSPSARERVLKFLKDLIGSSHSNLRICMTSRLEQDILSTLNPLTFAPLRVSLHEEGGQTEDINSYIRSFVYTNNTMRRWRMEDKEAVINTLTERAGGMFRWVYCQLDTLSRCFPPSIHKALSELPATLDDTYERMLQDIHKEKRHHAHRLLQCMVAAIRPLRVEELAEILVIKFDPNTAPNLAEGWRSDNPEEDVLSACSTLIAIIDDSGAKIVQFSHFSVKEFLTSDRLKMSSKDGDIRQYYISPEPAHAILAQACMAVLLQLDEVVDKKRLATLPLAFYAAQNLVNHAKFEDVASTPEIQEGLERLFNPNSPYLRAWTWIYIVEYAYERSMDDLEEHPSSLKATPLYYAAFCGFSALAEHLIVSHAEDVNATCGHFGSPLHAASSEGHVDAARVLLDHGADVNVRSETGESPLCAPCGRNDIELVQLLLEHGAIVEAASDMGCRPLHSASESGGVQVVQLLLQHKVDVNAEGPDRWTALHYASRYGHPKVAKLLLEHGADLNAQSKSRSTPLYWAASDGQLEIVRLLLGHGADVNIRGYHDSTAFQTASKEGHHDIAQLLLEYGAE